MIHEIDRRDELIAELQRRIQELQQPTGWGADSLTEYIENSNRNRYATFANKKERFNELIFIDKCFIIVFKDWINPQNNLSPHLFIRSHAAYRAACENAMSGQVAQAFPQLRACIEYAGYGLHIMKNPEVSEIFLKRHEDNEGKGIDRVRKEFTIKNINSTIKKLNKHLSRDYHNLYNKSIDFGAHPNEMSVINNLKVLNSEKSKNFLQMYLHGDGVELSHILDFTCQIGICALEVFQEAFQARFELLGVREDLLRHRRKFCQIRM
jgi:hypothetical protein